jgi:PKHD-type hydroxylase
MVRQEEVVYRRIFTPAECDRILDYSAGLPESDATLSYQGIDARIRKTKNKFLRVGPETAWIEARVKKTVEKLNNRYFKFNLSQLEDLQILKYAESGHFHWHNDVAVTLPFSKRKLSFIAFLSERSSYEGGQLEIIPVEENNIPMEKGFMVLFPSFKTHRVLPVTWGVRYTLVSWARGIE